MANKMSQTHSPAATGLPMRPGSRVECQVADGLVDPQALAEAEPIPASDLGAALVAQRKAALEQNVAATPTMPKVITEPEPVVPDALPEGEKKGDDAGKPMAISRTHCPKCGFKLDSPVFTEPTEKDKRDFLRSILSKSRFTKTFGILGGSIRVTFRSPEVTESDDVSVQLRRELAEAGNFDPRFLYIRALRLNMAVCLQDISFVDGDKVIDHKKYPTADATSYPEKTEKGKTPTTICTRAHDSIFAIGGPLGSYALYNALYAEYRKFDHLHEVLVSRSDDPDFWTATPSAQ